MRLGASTLPDGSYALELSIKPGDVPTEFMILAKGRTETVKGPVVFSERSAQAVMARLKKLGRDKLNFDYGHGQLGLIQTAETSKSGGWFKLDVRDGDLWATDIEWTPTAFKGLSEREWRYFSPAIGVDPKTNEVLSLSNIALTNLPATIDQKPIIASANPNPTQEPMDPELLKLLGALNVSDVSQVGERFKALSAERDGLLDTVKETETQLSAANAKLEAVEADKAAAARDAYIVTLSTGDAPVLSPAMAKNWAPTQTIEQLKAFAASAPPVVQGSKSPEVVNAPDQSGTITTLSEDERKIVKMMGLSEKEYLANKAVQLSETNFWSIDPTKEIS